MKVRLSHDRWLVTRHEREGRTDSQDVGHVDLEMRQLREEHRVVDDLVDSRQWLQTKAASVVDANTHVFSHLSHLRKDLAQRSEGTGKRIDTHKESVSHSLQINGILGGTRGIHRQAHRVESPLRVVALFESILHDIIS